MGYMGWENVRHFIGSSWQVHVEMINLEREMKESYLMSAKRDAQIISVIEKIFKGRQNENSK